MSQAYVQDLESSRVKLMQLEQELDRARQQVTEKFDIPMFILLFSFFQKGKVKLSSNGCKLQGLYIGGGLDAGHLGFSGAVNSGLLVNILGIIILSFDLYTPRWNITS